MMEIPKVKPVLRLVPNGFVPNGKGGKKFYMTLMATPVQDDGGFSLDLWPKEIFDKVFATSGLPIWTAEKPTAQLPDNSALFAAAAAGDAFNALQNTNRLKAWQAIVPEGASLQPEMYWNLLLDSIHLSLSSAAYANVPAPASNVTVEQLNGVTDENGAYKSQQADPTQPLTIKSVLPVKHGDLALLLEYERADYVQQQLNGDLPSKVSQSGPESELASTAPLTKKDGDEEKDISKADLVEALRAAKLEQLKKALDELQDERAKSAGGKCELRSHDTLKATIDNQTEKDTASTAMSVEEASHLAGSWPQSRAGEVTQDLALTCVTQAYHAIVSSPTWARIFGFAFDIYIDIAAGEQLPAWVSAQIEGVTIPPRAVQKGTTLLPVWSAVDVKTGWPFSPTGALESGLYKLGAGCADGQVSRFDAVTLDVREAADARARPLMTDGNNRRAFQTAGFTLVDRQRADDVRGQLQRTTDLCKEMQGAAAGDAEKLICLYAEDLAVGRRLHAGVYDGKGGLIWRPLGARKVSYGFRRDAGSKGEVFDELNVSKLLAAGKTGQKVRTLENAILNAAARLTPNAGGGAQDRDVFVDEAFVTWDGAPMGVHSGPQPIAAAAVQAGGAKFPFLQKQSLPGKGDGEEALATAQRYGNLHRFAMPAVFLGGCSLDIDDAAKKYDLNVQDYTYPRDPYDDGKKTPLRRFVRQEPIGAPFVLMPASVLDADPGEMDFETIHSAVLRSVPLNYEEDKELPDKTESGRPYTKARQRQTGNELVRIFVPPIAPLQELLRAGMFDNKASRASVIAGGLRKTAFGSALAPKGNIDPPSAAGFPIAAIAEKRAFGFEPTRRLLSADWPKHPTKEAETLKRGAAIFIARGSFDKKSGQMSHWRPYYPDPFAQKLCIRLRRRADGQYHTQNIIVPVYDNKQSYPNAMPTAVVIKKGGKTKIGSSDAETNPVAVTICSEGFSFKPGPASGERMQSVEITLAPGDDYQLEAFYLPECEELALKFALTEMLGAKRLLDQGASGRLKKGIAVTTGFLSVPDDDGLKAIANELCNHVTGSVESGKRTGPIEDLAAVAHFRVAHAVSRPLQIFRFAENAGDAALKIVRGIAKKPAAQQDADREGQPPLLYLADAAKAKTDVKDTAESKDFLLTGQIEFDRRMVSAIEIIASCVSPRDPLFDDPARRRPLKARVSGAWPRKTISFENGKPVDPKRVPADVSDVYGFKSIDQATGSVTLQQSEILLLRIDNIAGPGGGALTDPLKEASGGGDASRNALDLGLAHVAAQLARSLASSPGEKDLSPARHLLSASQMHTFPDGKARKLRLSLRAISRFATDFETAPRWKAKDTDANPVVRLRQPLHPLEQSVRSTDDAVPVTGLREIDVWLPASQSPAKCAALAPVPVFQHVQGREGAERYVKRRAGARIYLERRWYSSGEGERLGILLEPETAQPSGTFDFHTDDEFGPLGPYVSRWGGDPIRRDNAPLRLPLRAKDIQLFDDACKDLANLVPTSVLVPVQAQLPTKPGEINAPPPERVFFDAKILTFEPRFDVDREQWFVDLGLSETDTPNLFVRLGLVRYQENAISKELQVSEPVTVWTQLLPERTLSVKCFSSADQISFCATVSGRAHVGMQIPAAEPSWNLTGFDAAKLTLHLPTIKFRAVHESGAGGLMRRIELANVTMPPADGDTRPHLSRSHLFRLPRAQIEALGPGRIYVYAEETERFMPASYDLEPAYISDIFDPSTFVESGPRFAARMEVDVSSSPTEK
jgi:hypothetical protein